MSLTSGRAVKEVGRSKERREGLALGAFRAMLKGLGAGFVKNYDIFSDYLGTAGIGIGITGNFIILSQFRLGPQQAGTQPTGWQPLAIAVALSQVALSRVALSGSRWPSRSPCHGSPCHGSPCNKLQQASLEDSGFIDTREY
jgi:hypothetical protein